MSDDYELHHGDCVEVMRTLPDASVHAVVTDPPYGLEFMGKDWDRPWAVGMTKPGYSDADRMARPAFGDNRNANCQTCGGRQRGVKRCECVTPNWDRHPREDMLAFGAWCQEWASEAYRLLKPGGYLLAFGGTRTYHRLACAIEDAGFEIRDSITWLYGSGFPKSLDVSKAIDKSAGAVREVVGQIPDRWAGKGTVLQRSTQASRDTANITAPATDAAREWEGWGTALKPASEPIVVARKPPAGTVAQNVLTYGTGALHIDGCRVGDEARTNEPMGAPEKCYGGYGASASASASAVVGRWPANVVMDEFAAAELDAQSGTLTSGANPTRRGSDKFRTAYGDFTGQEECVAHRGTDSGGASRFFPVFRYEAKAPTAERPRDGDTLHPTVKPLDLMRWLVRLVTPRGGTVLDPFAGSGTTAEACIVEGFHCITIEREAAYLPLIIGRLSKPISPVLDFGESA